MKAQAVHLTARELIKDMRAETYLGKRRDRRKENPVPLPGNQLPEETLKTLHNYAPPGARLYVINRGTSASNMTQYVDVYALSAEDSHMIWLSRLINRTCPQFTFNNRRECLEVSGIGYNRPATVISALSSRLHGDPQALKFDLL